MTEALASRRSRLLPRQWLELLEEDSFRRYWFMRLASHGATNALGYALLVFTVRESDTAIATGLLLLTLIVPSAMLGAIAGVAVDRLPRGLILFTACAARAVLALALISFKDGLPGIYAVSLGLGIVTQFAAPAEAAVVPYIVNTRGLVAANSFISLGTLASQLLGMLVLAPALLKTTNGDPLLWLLVALFAVSAALIVLIPQFRFSSEEARRGVSLRVVRREFAEGWQVLSRDSVAFLALVLLVVASISTLIIATMLPKFSLQVLNVRPENIVLVLAPAGVAVFLGLRSVEVLSARFNKLVTIGASYVLMATSLIALGLVTESAGSLRDADPFGIFADGLLGERGARVLVTIVYANVFCFGLTVVLTMGRVLINERVPLAMQGRVFAAQSVLSNLVAIVPVLAAGLVADAFGVAPVLICAGVAALLAAAWSQMRSSRIHQPAAPPLR